MVSIKYINLIKQNSSNNFNFPIFLTIIIIMENIQMNDKLITLKAIKLNAIDTLLALKHAL